MLETIREFGLEQLAATGETEATMQRLAGWCRSLLEGVEEAFFTAMQGRWVERLEAEHDNLRAVLTWALEQGDAATAQVFDRKAGLVLDPPRLPERGPDLGRTRAGAWRSAPTPAARGVPGEDGHGCLDARRP